MSLVRPYLRRYLAPFSGAIALLTVESVCDLLQPTIMARMIDTGVAARDSRVVLHLGLVMLGVAAIGAVGAAGRNIVASLVSYRFAAQLRAEVFARITSFSFTELNRFDSASLVTRQTNDITQVQGFVNGIMRIFAKAPILACGSLVMSVLLEPRLALVLVVVVPTAGVLLAASLAMGFPRFRLVQEGLDRVNSVTREYLGGIRVVKAFAQEEREVGRFAAANAGLTDASRRALEVMAVFGPAIALVVNLGVVAVLWLGGSHAGADSLRVGRIIALVNYMSQLLFSLMMIANVFTVFVRARASWDRIGEVLRVPGAEAGERTGVVTGDGRGGGARVEFRSVGFSYPAAAGRRVLEGVDLACEPGRTTAVIGPTGSGKSTLAALVPRLWEPTEGEIRLGGEAVQHLELAALRQRIALVPQQTILFTGTIAANLRWGREEAAQEELEEAARAACAHDFVAALPEGYASVLGQGGVNLSGGQKQRLAIARALVRRPEVLILDDCTSAVDSLTEAEILAGIRRRAAGCTCILITQRISAAAAADRILVLEDGRPVGMGDHRRLLRDCEVYRDICVAQLGREAVDATGNHV